MVALFTSLPPAMSRQDANGREIGSTYQSACISSWQKLGFKIHSVNSRAELETMPKRPLSVHFHACDTDARFRTGRPHIYFHDLIRNALRAESDQIVITNADILLEPAFELKSLVAKLRPGRALIANRTDISDIGSRRGTRYVDGYDFFAVHRRDLSLVEDASLIFGAPWWDHFLPTYLCSKGIELQRVNERFAYHLLHGNRWSSDLWQKVGLTYAEFWRQKIRTEAPPADNISWASLRARMEKALNPDAPPLRQQARWLRKGKWRRKMNQPALHVLAKAAVASINAAPSLAKSPLPEPLQFLGRRNDGQLARPDPLPYRQ